MSEVSAARGQGNRRAIGVSHVAGTQCRYPGEVVAFYTQVEVRQPVPGFTLQVTVPEGLTLGNYRALNGTEDDLPVIAQDGRTNYLLWSHEGEDAFPARFEYLVEATVAAVEENTSLESRAVVTATDDSGATIQDAETAVVAVAGRGSYLSYLPAIYQQDELMGRFLMLFESFWGPLEGQIDALPFYFDPRLTPPEFLPWLASWIDLVLDERWPEQKRRQLLSSAARLYRKRGTRQGLEEYLEIYTGEKPHIVEHRAHNFRLGIDARLGPSVALGTDNEPHTFTVTLRLPSEETRIVEKGETQSRERHRHWERRVKAIIDAEKPAHAGYRLEILDA